MAALLEGLAASAFSLADRAVICDIETEGQAQDLDGQRWYDVSPMVDSREHSPQFIDMASEALAYATARGLIAWHPCTRQLVRICTLANPSTT